MIASRTTTGRVVYLLVLATIIVGSLVLVWTVARPHGLHVLGWSLGVLVAVATLSGTWLMRDRRAADR